MKKFRFEMVRERFREPLTIAGALRYYGVSRSTLYRMMRVGLIEYERDKRTGRVKILSGPKIAPSS